MRKTIWQAMIAGCVLTLAGTAVAQQPPVVRVRGEITGYADRVLTVKTREGNTVQIKLAEQFGVIVPQRFVRLWHRLMLAIRSYPQRPLTWRRSVGDPA